MSDVDHRFAPWLELVSELLATPGEGGFPRVLVEAALVVTFGCRLTWNWRTPEGDADFEMVQGPDLQALTPGLVQEWEAGGGLDNHPLLAWFAQTGDSAAMTVGRVPQSIAPAAGAGLLRELLAPYACEQQLSIPVRIAGVEHRAYVLARGQEDFSDEDLSLARRIQPLLQLLDRQAAVLEGRAPLRLVLPDLTGRERAILHLLGDGLTATAIGRRLAVSPRTVHKHLEHLYRKLGVRDRLDAVLVARDAGLLAQHTREAAGAHGGPVT